MTKRLFLITRVDGQKFQVERDTPPSHEDSDWHRAWGKNALVEEVDNSGLAYYKGTGELRAALTFTPEDFMFAFLENEAGRSEFLNKIKAKYGEVRSRKGLPSKPGL